MFAKIATIILVLGAMYGALLVNRQKRIDAASQISRIHFRMQEADHEKVRLQVKVAELTTATALEKRIGTEKLATDYKSVPYRHDPTRAVESKLGDALAVAEPPAAKADAKSPSASAKSTAKTVANKPTSKKKKEIGG
jgi:cell division protein FtsN